MSDSEDEDPFGGDWGDETLDVSDADVGNVEPENAGSEDPEPESFGEGSGQDWSVHDLDLDESDEVSGDDLGVDREEFEQSQQRFGAGAINAIKERVWNQENIPSMPSLPSREDLPGGSITGWRPEFMRQAEEEAGQEASQADEEAGQEDPESSVDEDEAVDDPDVDSAAEEVADEEPELPAVTLEAPNDSDVAPLEDAFREEREFLRHSKSAQDFESALNGAVSALAEGNQGVIQRAEEINQNLDRLTSQLETEVAQHNPEDVESWIMRWNRVKGYIEFASSNTPTKSNPIAIESALLNGENSFDADGRSFLKDYKGLETRSYGLKQVRQDLESILKGHLRPIAGGIDQSYSQEQNLMENLVSELVNSQKIYSKMMILRMNLDVIEDEQGDYVKLISEIEGGAIMDKQLRQNAKAEIQKLQEGEMELGQLAGIEKSILENMFEANKLLKRQYELTSHEFESLYESGEGREGIEEDLRNFIEALGLENSSEVYDEFNRIRELMREVAQLSQRITVEKADQLEWYIKVSKMISEIITAEKQYYRSTASEEESYEEQVDEEVGNTEQEEVPELDELEKQFIKAYNEYIEIDGDELVSKLGSVREELKDMVEKTGSEENHVRDFESDVEQIRATLDKIDQVSKEEFRDRVIKGTGETSLENLADEIDQAKNNLENIEKEEHVLKKEHEDLKTKMKNVQTSLKHWKEIRRSITEIHARIEEDGIEQDFRERVNPEIHVDYMRFIGQVENGRNIQQLIDQSRELLEKETRLESEEMEMLREAKEELNFIKDTEGTRFELTDHGRAKIQNLKKAIQGFSEEVERVGKLKSKAMGLDNSEEEALS